jgi:hypothetical protein
MLYSLIHRSSIHRCLMHGLLLVTVAISQRHGYTEKTAATSRFRYDARAPQQAAHHSKNNKTPTNGCA